MGSQIGGEDGEPAERLAELIAELVAGLKKDPPLILKEPRGGLDTPDQLEAIWLEISDLKDSTADWTSHSDLARRVVSLERAVMRLTRQIESMT